MAGKEVLLSIDVDGIVQACLSINSRYAVDGDTTRSNKVNDFMILNDILRDNLKIENGLSDEEKQDAVDIVMNRICEYFLYNNYGMSAILGLYFALVSGKNELIRSRAIALVNNITKPNTFIYSPIYGIHRKGGAVEDINPNGDLKPIVCTLEIGGTHFSNLKETLHATSESLARQNASYLSEERQILNIFNVFSSQKEYYTLYELYNCIHNGAGVPLVDYGLKLIFEKNSELEELVSRIEELQTKYDDPLDAVEENSEIFSREDLQIITAIKENIGEIACEKIIHSCVIRALEYIANNTDLLRETENGSNTLKIKKDLSNFYEDYIANRDLGKLIQQRKDKITEKIKTKTKALGEEETKYYQIKESASREKIEDAICTINSLENDVYRLECDKKKECLQPEYMQSLLNSLLLLSEVSPEQESYLFEKIKEFGKAMSIEIVELSKEHQTAKEKEKEPKKRRLFTMKAIHAKIAKTLLLAAILLTPPLLVNYYCSNGGVMGAADNGNPVNCEESSYYE